MADQVLMSNSPKPGTPARKVLSEKFLRRVGLDIGKEWFLLSLTLGLTNAELERIQYDCSDVETKIVKALLKWRSKSLHLTSHSQLEQLITSLKENKRNDLVEKYGKYLDEQLLMQVSTENESKDEKDENIAKLYEMLLLINKEETQRIPVSSLKKTISLSIEEIFAPLHIKEGLRYKRKVGDNGTECKPETEGKAVNCPDIFFINKEDGETVRNVFLLGDAGQGKTVFCQKLINHWCNAHEKTENQEVVPHFNEWEAAMNEFHFFFHVKLRHVDENKASLIDMICLDVFDSHPECHETIRRVLSSRTQKCLVTVDGLDEWKFSNEMKSKLKYEGLPNLNGLMNCTILWTCRPFKTDDIIETIGSRDRVLETHGLEENGLQVLINKMLTNFYEIDLKSSEFETLENGINNKFKNFKFKSMMQIPSVAIECIQMWRENMTVADSVTNFFIALIEMFVARAHKKKDITRKDEAEIVLQEPSGERNFLLQQRFSESNFVLEYLPVLQKLGEIAYIGLISKEQNFAFMKRDLEKKLGKPLLDFALKVGLLTQGSSSDSFSFFHKSMQEFLGSLHVASYKDYGVSLCSILTDIQIIFEFENIIEFLCGLNPSTGNLLSKHIAGLIDSDADECYEDKIRLLYILQLSCFREMRHLKKFMNTKELPTVSDVYIDNDSDANIIQNTVDILQNHHSAIKSLTIFRVPTESECGVPDGLLSDFLCETMSLQALFISGLQTDRIIYKIGDIFCWLTALHLIQVTITVDALDKLQGALKSNKILKTLGLCEIRLTFLEENKDVRQPAPLDGLIKTMPSLELLTSLLIKLNSKEEKLIFQEFLQDLLSLMRIVYIGSNYNGNDYNYDDGDEVHTDYNDASIIEVALHCCPRLRNFVLHKINMGPLPLEIKRHMTHLDEIWLLEINMSDEVWFNFVMSLMRIDQEIKVKLHETNITTECQEMIRSLPDFEITKCKVKKNGMFKFEFTKLCALTV